MPASSLDFHRQVDATLNLDFLFSIRELPADHSNTANPLCWHKLPNRDRKHPAYYYAKQEVLITRELQRRFDFSLV